MKRFLALMLACIMLLCCGCGGADDTALATPNFDDHAQIGDNNDSAPTPTPTPTLAPTPTPAPQYVNPLNGEILSAPYTGRIVACSISNKSDAIPHAGLNDADIYMEMFVNNSIIRGLALYTDVSKVNVIGSIRSNRLMFNDIVTHYDAITVHSGGSDQVLNATWNEKIDNANVGIWDAEKVGASYRDQSFGRIYENTLFAKGPQLANYIEKTKELRVTGEKGKNYYLTFVDDGTPNGETANTVSVKFTYQGAVKETIMKYDAATDRYIYHQYGEKMSDLFTKEDEGFTNVIVMNTKISMNGKYQVADFTAGGDGYYANGGQLIPITWSCAGDREAFQFFTADGKPLELGRGNSYIAIAPIGSPITWG